MLAPLLAVGLSLGQPGCYSWVKDPRWAGQLNLVQDGTIVGAVLATGEYRNYNSGNQTWGPVSKPPINPPQEATVKNFGVAQEKVEKDAVTLNGKPCTMAEAFAAIGKGTLVDDSKKLRLTVYGPNRERVLYDLKNDARLLAFSDHLLTQGYDAEHWAVKTAGFPSGGSPDIVIQDGDGKVLHRQKGYDGPEALAKAIRKADPKYDPSKDPDLRNASDPVNKVKEWLSRVDYFGVPNWAFVAVAAVFLYFKKKGQKNAGQP